MSNSNRIFNVDEVRGKEHSALETSAAEAQKEAPNARIAREIEKNAKQGQTAAEQAAAVAETMSKEYTGEPMTASDKLQGDVSNMTKAAITEGKEDVDHVKAVGAGYVEQVKELARNAIGTAQTYLPESIANQLPNLSEGATVNAESQPSSTSDIHATPLKSDPHSTVNSPTMTKKGTKCGKRIEPVDT